ncbi:MAG: GDSL-type esterase/lipase family protein, partial [Saprospiraceae bacterium]
MRYFRSFALLLLLPYIACQHKMEQPVPAAASVKILALGDSYTKGESVVFAQNFPNQLADSLRAEGQGVVQTRIIAQTGWRTDNLQTAMTDAHIGDSTYDLVTLCIGVNNQYQHGNFTTFKTQFEQL